MEPIVTLRLVVRRFTSTDLADFLAYQSLPEVRRHLRGEPMTEDAAARYLAAQAVLPEDERGRWHGYAVEVDGRVVGDVGVFLQNEPSDEGDVGFQFHPAVHGQGVAFEATRALIDRLFGDLELSRVTSGCDAANVASFRLMERLGMRRVRELDEGLTYELTRKDWDAKRP